MDHYSVLVAPPGETIRRVSRHFRTQSQAVKLAKRLMESGTHPETIYIGIDHDQGSAELIPFDEDKLPAAADR